MTTTTTQTFRRARHSVSLPHAHLVFVTKYRRAVFTDAMLTFCEQTMRGVCAELDVELVEFNGGDLGPGAAAQRPRTAYAVRREFTGVCVRARMPDTSGRRPTSLSPAAVRHCRSSSNTSTDKPDHCEGRATPGDTRDGLTPH